MHISAIVAYGCPPPMAIKWLDDRGATQHLTESEADFIRLGSGDPQFFRNRIEGLWTLAWSLHMFEELDFFRPVSNKFIEKFPSLSDSEGWERHKSILRIRDIRSIAEAADLAYCLHWCMVDTYLRNYKIKKADIPVGILERRRALDWLLTDEGYDEITLDT